MPAKKTPTKKKISARKPIRSHEIPVSKAMLDKMEQKLKHEMTSFRLEVNAKFKQVDAKFKQVDARFNQLDSKIETVIAAVHRIGLLVEEQNARNKLVLDGYTSLNDRIEKLEHADKEKDF